MKRQLIVNSGLVDASGDRYFLRGIDVDRFLNNPVLLYQHDKQSLPIGKFEELSITSEGLVGTVDFYEPSKDLVGEHIDLVKTIIDLVDKKMLNGVSISTLDKETYLNEFGGEDIMNCELLEVSLVTIPCDKNSIIKEEVK